MKNVNSEKKHILIIDDDRSIQIFLKRVLEKEGYETKTTGSIQQTLEFLPGNFFDLAFVDLELSDGKGTCLIKPLKEALPSIALVMISAHSSAESAARAFRKGIMAYLVKPISSQKLLKITEDSLIKQQLLQEKEEAETKIKSERIKFENILENMIDGVTIFNMEGKVSYINQATTLQLGYTRDECIGQDFSDLFIDKKELPKFHKIMETIKTSKQLSGIQFLGRHKDGKQFALSINLSLLENSEDNVSEIIAVHRDISNLQKLQQELIEARKLEAIGQLSAGIAHEINTPTQYIGDNTHFLQDSFKDLIKVFDRHEQLLAAVKSNTVSSELIKDTEKANEEADIPYLQKEIPKAIKESLEGIERVTKIVQAMKIFSHPGVQEKNNADINNAIESTITIARNEWKYVADIETDLDSSLLPVPCFIAEFNQCILNLIINASHAISDVVGEQSDTKGTITITTRQKKDLVEIRISDTGGGIPEEIKGKIFNPFFTTKPVGKGTGQGLSICRAVIVEKHGGKLNFETEMGKGTTFIIQLPLARKEESECKTKKESYSLTMK